MRIPRILEIFKGKPPVKRQFIEVMKTPQGTFQKEKILGDANPEKRYYKSCFQ